ncbi:ABC transporter permease [Persicitalea jodogahamensis]|uniref:ABC transporter permease n=1 Tax=Persicitalea jodogahamensis TaxID=402147 RepID=A0A8J3GAK5_9BACT|nr:ABC transporter permease [Persicitalea jodogahamensis]GHB83696.1 ABC transporter permease [Persicitalea jodogahamensis]
MLTSYLKIAFRMLRKQRALTFINIVGLATGLACCMLIMLYVLDELNYDRYNTNADRIYRIQADIKFGGNDMHFAVSPDPIGPTLKKDYPQVEQFVRLHNRGTWLVKREDESTNLREDNITFADSTLFEVFTLPLVAGNPKRALAEPNTVVISESAAKRHFGNRNPMGQTLVFVNKQAYTVTGVMRDMPKNSHFHSDFFLTMLNDDYTWGQWLSNNHHTYVLLKPGTDPQAFAKNFDAIIEKYMGPQVMQIIGSSLSQFRKAGNTIGFWLIPLTDIHLHSKQQVELAPNGDIQYVYIFSAVALFILLIACVNFMNLATARSSNRAKEVGVRKVMGSERPQLIGQFMTESILITILAMLLALVMVAMALPGFNGIAAKELNIMNLISPYQLPWLIALPFVVGLLTGSYPAFFLSSFKPIAVLKGRVSTSFRSSGLRSGLVIFQFAMSVILIVGTIIIYRQISYIQTKNVGFNRNQVVTIEDVHAIGKQAESFRQEVMRLPGVVGGSVSGYLPTPSNRSDNAFWPEGQTDMNKGINMQNWGVDYDYLKTLGMTLVAGRDFSRDFGSDSSGIILNEAAVKVLGFKDPIGKRIFQFEDEQAKIRKTYTILGVVKNFHFESLRRNIGALSMTLSANSGAASFRVSSTNLPALMKQIETKWKQIAPGQPFSYQFMNESFDAMYRAEQRIGTIAVIFAGLAVLIACLGLFGLASFMAEQRTKEIGVRKVLGASVGSIVALLSQDFLKLVLVAIIIASPIAWYAMNAWLADFAYKIEISWWIFALAGGLAICIALLTVSYQSIKAALMNPVKSLRSD